MSAVVKQVRRCVSFVRRRGGAIMMLNLETDHVCQILDHLL